MNLAWRRASPSVSNRDLPRINSIICALLSINIVQLSGYYDINIFHYFLYICLKQLSEEVWIRTSAIYHKLSEQLILNSVRQIILIVSFLYRQTIPSRHFSLSLSITIAVTFPFTLDYGKLSSIFTLSTKLNSSLSLSMSNKKFRQSLLSAYSYTHFPEFHGLFLFLFDYYLFSLPIRIVINKNLSKGNE